MAQTFEEIGVADFFYRNRDIAGFTSPSRAVFSAIRELVENSLDAAEDVGALPDVRVWMFKKGETTSGVSIYKVRVEDNGSGVPPQSIPSAFGKVLFGSKFKLRQARGTFGLGGTMAILYGQITTNKPVKVISSAGGPKAFAYKLMIDVERNRPIVLSRKVLNNGSGWRGTIIELHLEGDYLRAMPKVLEYLKQTALVNPHANITFVDPKGRLYVFSKATEDVPRPPKETKPHPYGVDVELLQRLIRATNCRNMLDFLRAHFHRVGEVMAKRFLESAGLDALRDPRSLTHDEVVQLSQEMKSFKWFLPPDASCLSPLGEELLRAGIAKELRPEFIAVCQRKPSAYSGHPFIVECAMAYGGDIPKAEYFTLYRFANRIPLLYDEASDVSFKVIRSINWSRYKISSDMPIAIFVHICSTKVPYKTIGKEFIADRQEVKREILFGIREVARQVQRFLSKREKAERQRKRLNVFAKYLTKIAQFSKELAKKEKPPNVERLLKKLKEIDLEAN